MLQFLKTTLVGGILFLIPLVVLVIVVGKALAIAHRLVDPLAAHIPLESVVGLRTPALLALVLVVTFCFTAGLFARTGLARKAVAGVENTVLSKVPGYDLVKSISRDLLGIDEQGIFPPVLVRFDEAWQIGFQVEVLDAGLVSVFIPDMPSPQSGSVFFVTADRVRPAGMSFAAAVKCLKRAGVGFGKQLHGIRAEE